MHTFKVALYDVPGAKPRETRWVHASIQEPYDGFSSCVS